MEDIASLWVVGLTMILISGVDAFFTERWIKISSIIFAGSIASLLIALILMLLNHLTS
jgi:hypothetical protein